MARGNDPPVEKLMAEIIKCNFSSLRQLSSLNIVFESLFLVSHGEYFSSLTLVVVWSDQIFIILDYCRLTMMMLIYVVFSIQYSEMIVCGIFGTIIQ